MAGGKVAVPRLRPEGRGFLATEWSQGMGPGSLATECVASGAGRASDLFLPFPVGLAPLATESVACGAGGTFGGAGLTFDLVLGLVFLRCTAVVGAVSGWAGSVWR